MYKKIMQLAAHCPVCREILLGNGSVFSPWQCSCGIWKWEVDEKGHGNYITKKLNQSNGG